MDGVTRMGTVAREGMGVVIEFIGEFRKNYAWRAGGLVVFRKALEREVSCKCFLE